MDDDEAETKGRLLTNAAVLTGAIALVASLSTAAITSFYDHVNKDKESNVKLVEIAISILRADPKKEDVSPARGWAIRLIQKYSGVPLTVNEIEQLMHSAIKGRFVPSYSSDYYPDYDSDYTPSSPGRTKQQPR